MDGTRIEPPTLPAEVVDVVRAIEAGSGRAWIVGGAVRDWLQGHAAREIDLATDLEPRAVAAALGNSVAGEVTLDQEHLGACRIRSGESDLTVTTLRSEAGHRDGRRPDEIRFVDDVDQDAVRRDFTVNALYLAPFTGRVEDPTGGLHDLARGVLRCIGEPERRFAEDALRLLRMVRFAASADLRIEPSSADAARRSARNLERLSAERCLHELTQMFCGRGRGRALRLLVEHGLADVVLPEVAAMDGVAQPPQYHPEGDVLTHVVSVLDHVPAGDQVLAWSAVLHDIGKPPTYREAADRIRFDGHDVLSAEMAEAVLRRLRSPTRLREQVVDVCRQHIRFAALPLMRPRKAERWLRSPSFRNHLAFHRADCLGSHQNLEIYEFALRRLAELPPLRPRWIHGKDVLALGVAPGPRVGEILQEVDELLAEAPEPTSREAALVLLRDVVRRDR